MPEVHAKLSPSAADRWTVCPGSVVLSEGIPERTSSYAEEGTKAHSIAEKMLKGLPSITNVEMRDSVCIYVDHVRELAAIPGAILHVEAQVHVSENNWGTADAIVWVPSTRVLYVRDLKYGAGIGVEVRGNLQLKNYALAALLEFKYPAHTVDMGIVQPRFNHAEGRCRSLEFSALDLLDFHADLMDAEARVLQAKTNGDLYLKFKDSQNPKEQRGAKEWADKYLFPSKKGCKFCLAAPDCPKLKNLAQDTAKQVFAVNTPYKPEDLQRTLDSLPILEGWIKNVREFAYEEAEKGNPIPGYKLVPKQANRKIVEGLLDQLAETFAVEKSALYGPAPILGVGEIQKLAPGKNDKERAKAMEPFVTKESSGHTLVHESDKREAIRVDAKAAFSEVSCSSVFD